MALPLRYGPVLLSLAFMVSLPAHGANKKPDIKLNPDARMKYEITATVSDPGLAFEPVKGHADYVVDTPNCVPLTRFSGATIVPEYRVPVELTRIAPNVYRGEMTFDLLKDEDYYGQGVCHWTLVAVGASFYRHKVNFSPALFKDDLLGKGMMQRYFSRKSYDHDQDERIDIGDQSAAQYKDPGNVFDITLRAKKLF